MDKGINPFKNELIKKIKSFQENAIIVLPEYCWPRNIDKESLKSSIIEIKEELSYNQQMVIGSAPIEIKNKKYNAAIYVNGGGETKFIPKTNVLIEERRRSNVIDGINPGYIEYNNLRVQILVCADMWDGKLLYQLLNHKNKVDLLLVPALTTVDKGLSNYSKYQWYSLSITRSREFIIPIVIADHMENWNGVEVGKASCIVDPSKKSQQMNNLEDFLVLPTNNIAIYDIDLSRIRKYKEYRIEKGIYRYE